MKDSNFSSGVYFLTEWIMRLAILHLLWLLLNLPIVVTVLIISSAPSLGVASLLLPFLFILFPLLFFPSTQALFAVARDWILQKDEQPPAKLFRKYLKENYKSSLISGFILSIAWTLLLSAGFYFSLQGMLLAGIFGILSLFLYLYTLNFFSASAHYALSRGRVFQKAFWLTFGSPALSFKLLASTGFVFLLSYLLPPIVFFFTGSLLASLAYLHFHHLYSALNKDTNHT